MKGRTDCSLCGLKFRKETQLRRHSSLVHGDYINTLIKNLQSDLPSKKPNKSIIVNDEAFRLLENNLGSETKITSKYTPETTPNLRRSKRIKKEINYFPDHQDLQRAEKSNKSKKRKGKKRERQFEIITLDSDSEETAKEDILIPALTCSEEELSTTIEITPMTPVSSQSKRMSFSNQKKCETSSLPKWRSQKTEEFQSLPACDHCAEVLPTKKDLERHVEDKHSFKCTKCVATIIFQTKSAFKVHNKRNHQN